jgi:Ca2+-binding RTX toxin-like protein
MSDINVLTSTIGDDFLIGSTGTDQFTATAGNDTLNGLGGIDTVVIYKSLSDVSITKTDSSTDDNWHVNFNIEQASKDGSGFLPSSSSLIAIERIQLLDTNLALDLDPQQNAGSALALLYAAFNTTPDPEAFGKWIAEADSLTSTTDSKAGTNKPLDTVELAQSMIDFYAPQGVSDSELVTLLHSNVIGTGPSAEQIDGYVNAIETGEYTQASFFTLAAQHEQNTIQLTGIQSQGLAYTPVDSKQG